MIRYSPVDLCDDSDCTSCYPRKRYVDDDPEPDDYEEEDCGEVQLNDSPH